MRHWYDLSSIEQEVGQLLACVWQEINWPISLFWICSQLVSFWLTPLVGMLPNVKSYWRVCLGWAGFTMVFDVSDNHYFSFFCILLYFDQSMSTSDKSDHVNKNEGLTKTHKKALWENHVWEWLLHSCPCESVVAGGINWWRIWCAFCYYTSLIFEAGNLQYRWYPIHKKYSSLIFAIFATWHS